MEIKKLNSIRAFAALYVMIAHLMLEIFKGSSFIFLFKFGQEAVMLFFLLSGFVISISYFKNPNINFGSYFIKRFRRIYFPVFCTYIISGLVYFKLNDSLNLSFSQIIGNLLMLQDFKAAKPGVWVDPYLIMAPCGLFHMSDGSIFYLFFIIKNFPKINIYIILFFSSISWILYLILPNQPLLIFSYLIIWWAGFEAAKLYLNHKEITYKSTIHINLSLAMMSLIVSLLFFT